MWPLWLSSDSLTTEGTKDFTKDAKGLSSDADVIESEFAYAFGFVDVSEVGDLRRPHQPPDAAHVERAELIPLRHEDERVCARRRGVLVLGVLDFGQNLPRLPRRDGVVCADARALLDERADDVNRRRFAHVVGLRLEREAEHGDLFALHFA